MSPLIFDHPAAQRSLCLAQPVGPAAPSTTSPPITVYVIDLDEAVRDALSISLCSSGFEAIAYPSAGQFLGALPIRPKGCLLVDYDLDDRTGPELVAHLLTREIALPAVIMSARLRGPLLQPPPPGIAAVLQKPFGRNELLASLQRALRNPAR